MNFKVLLTLVCSIASLFAASTGGLDTAIRIQDGNYPNTNKSSRVTITALTNINAGSVVVSNLTALRPVMSSASGQLISATNTGTGPTVLQVGPLLTQPSIANFASANHDHSSSTQGGTLSETALALGDVTTANVSTSAHGFAKKLDNNAGHFYNGQGNWVDLSGGTSLLNDLTWGDGSDSSIIWGWNVPTGTDPAFTFSDGSIDVTSGQLKQNGVAVITTAAIDNTAYDATTWNGDNTHAPSKDAIRDKFESLGGGTANWVGSGTTNSTLPGIASGYASVWTNGVTTGDGSIAGAWNFSNDVTVTNSATNLLEVTGGTLYPSGGFRLVNAAGTSTLATSGDIALNTTDKQIGVYNGSKEVAIPLIHHQVWVFDPKAVCDGSVDRLFLMTIGPDAPKGITITRWNLSFEADPTTEVDLDLKRADAFIGVANSAVMDVLDTTAGASSETAAANINSGAVVANGKVVYLEFGTAYTETGHQCIFEMWWEVEED